MWIAADIQVLTFPVQAVQAPAFKKNPSLHPIAFAASPDEQPSALVASVQVVHTPPLKKNPATQDKATGEVPVAAPVVNGIHYDKSEFKVNPVKQDTATVKPLVVAIGAVHDLYPTLQTTGTKFTT